MKVKEIEFGVTVNLGNYESSKLSLRVELEDWEDYKQSLAKLKEEVVQLAGGDADIMRRIATDENTQEVIKKLEATQREYRRKKSQLDGLLSQLENCDERIEQVSDLLKKFEQFNEYESSLQDLQKIVRSYENLMRYKKRNPPTVDTDEQESDSSDEIIYSDEMF